MLIQQLIKSKYKNHIYCLGILFFCCIVAYWPLSFNVFSLKNDALNYFLPVRYQISESISYGYWPFWSPYFNLGYPLHGDMQSGVWNPIVQIFSLFGPYQLQTLQYETLLYIYISGVGMYFLMNHFIKERRICLFISVSFMLSGYNTDSTQFLNWISSASFLPFSFLFYYRTVTEKVYIYAPLSAFFLFMLFTTAYPADFILTVYLLFFFLVWYFLKKENRHPKILVRHLKLHAIVMIVFILLSMPAIISYVEFLQLSQRGSGASFKEAMSNPLHPFLLISYFTPLPVWKANFAEITDPLTRNSYIGIFILGLFITSLLSKFKNRIIIFLKWGFLLSFIFSLGETGGIRVLSYYVLPLMDSFRHPSNARLFSIFFACLLAGFTLYQILNEPQLFTRSKKITWYIILISFILLFFVSVFVSPNSLLEINTNGPKQFLDSLDFYELLLINILIQIPFLGVFYFFYIKKINLNALLISSLINMILLTSLYQPFTVIKNDSVQKIQKIINDVKRDGYPRPDLTKTLAENSATGMQYFKEIGVSNMYNKTIGRVDYRITPSNLNSQNKFWLNEKIRMHFLQYPLLYKADTIVDVKDTANLLFSNKKVLLSENYPIPPTSINQEYRAVVKEMSPLHLKIEINCSEAGYYNLFQNFYPRWKLQIDGKSTEIERSNISFIGFQLTQGTHQIDLYYWYKDLVIAYTISIVVLALIIIWVIVYWWRN